MVMKSGPRHEVRYFHTESRWWYAVIFIMVLLLMTFFVIGGIEVGADPPNNTAL